MAAINDLIAQIKDEDLRLRIEAEVKRLLKHKKFGLVFEDHLPEGLTEGSIYPCLRMMDQVHHAPHKSLWHALIEADNYYALQLLAYLYPGMVDCIYIDPPYNTGARDWKYNNDYVDSSDQYRHSKWLSMMKRRLLLAKKLLNPRDQKVNEKKPCYSVFDKSRPIDGNSLQVYHVHGFIPQNGDWSPIVLGEKEYHQIYQESYNWGNVEQLHALCRSACLFIGLSMTDPNLRRLIDISNDGGEVEPVHYAFLRKIEYDVPFMEKVMRGFGVNCVWYDRHEELPELLESLCN